VQRSVQDLLEDGEHVERELEVGADRLVVTDRRLLAFTPTGEGKNYRHVERPNVESVGLRVRSGTGHVRNGLLYLLVGLGTVTAGLTIDTDGLLGGVSTGSGAGALGVGGIIEQVATWVALVDDAIVALGVVILLPTIYHAVAYYRSRRSVLAVGVAGGEDIDLPTDRVEDPSGAVERLRLALDLPTGEASEEAPEWSTAS